MQLEVIGARYAQDEFIGAEFRHNDRDYVCQMVTNKGTDELRIRNLKGEILSIQKGSRTGTLSKRFQSVRAIDVTQEPYFGLIKASAIAWQNRSVDF